VYHQFPFFYNFLKVRQKYPAHGAAKDKKLFLKNSWFYSFIIKDLIYLEI